MTKRKFPCGTNDERGDNWRARWLERTYGTTAVVHVYAKPFAGDDLVEEARNLGFGYNHCIASCCATHYRVLTPEEEAAWRLGE